MSTELAYLDTSALVKLLLQEREAQALRQELELWPRRASSALLGVELLRVVRRSDIPALLALARRQLDTIHLRRLDQEILDRASELEPRSLRSLDAIHLASALALGDQLGTVVSYDQSMV